MVFITATYSYFFNFFLFVDQKLKKNVHEITRKSQISYKICHSIYYIYSVIIFKDLLVKFSKQIQIAIKVVEII